MAGIMKQFLVIGNGNATTYKETFRKIYNKEMWPGYDFNTTYEFEIPDYYEKHSKIENGKKYGKLSTSCWFTNLPVEKENYIELTQSYYDNPDKYPKYDNYDAINVDRVKDIPFDYDGVIGVPITVLSHLQSDGYLHFSEKDKREIINAINRYANIEDTYTNPKGTYGTNINGKPKYKRILIKKKLKFEIIDAREIALNERQKNKSTYLIKDADSAINGKPTYARICIKLKKVS